jgi:hypothetical protein
MKENQPNNIPQNAGGFTVAASPLNSVKLELAVICCVGVLLFLLEGRITHDSLLQLGLLAAYGVISMVWIIYRVRQVVRKISDRHGQNQE